jgi:hypothetical protein
MPSVARAADRGSLGYPTGRRDPRCLKTGSTGWAQSADGEISGDGSPALITRVDLAAVDDGGTRTGAAG